MADWSPKDLDKLFQDGSEQHDFPYNPDAWNQMEDLLEKDKKRRFFWWILGATGLISLLIFGWIQLNDSNSKKIENPISSSDHKSAFNEIAKHIEKNDSSDSSSTILQSWNNIGRQRIEFKNPISCVETFPANLLEQNSIVSNQKRKSVTQKIDTPIKKSISQPININKKEIAIHSDTQNTSTININEIASISIQELDIQNKLVNSSIKPLPKPKNNRFFLGLVLGADGSSVDATDFTNINWEIGVQTGYRFGKRFSFDIGLTYTQQKYQAKKDDYTPPQGFWTRKIAPEYTQAECNILEIPMTLGYFHNGFMNQGVYTNIGVTSYFMLKERYNFFYDLPDADLRRKWGTENENFHLFSMAQLGFGYQFINRYNHTLQIEPYAQIPLSGIGHGQVKLYSFGINLRYGVMF